MRQTFFVFLLLLFSALVRASSIQVVGLFSSETINGYQVMLSSVSIGGIKINNVEASVIEGNYPDIVLMGMSYLKHVKLSEHAGIMQLEAAY